LKEDHIEAMHLWNKLWGSVINNGNPIEIVAKTKMDIEFFAQYKILKNKLRYIFQS
jgi:hypothetical protein